MDLTEAVEKLFNENLGPSQDDLGIRFGDRFGDDDFNVQKVVQQAHDNNDTLSGEMITESQLE